MQAPCCQVRQTSHCKRYFHVNCILLICPLQFVNVIVIIFCNCLHILSPFNICIKIPGPSCRPPLDDDSGNSQLHPLPSPTMSYFSDKSLLLTF